MVNFFESIAGQRFINHTVPQLVRQLENLNDSGLANQLEKLNNNLERNKLYIACYYDNNSDYVKVVRGNSKEDVKKSLEELGYNFGQIFKLSNLEAGDTIQIF